MGNRLSPITDKMVEKGTYYLSSSQKQQRNNDNKNNDTETTTTHPLQYVVCGMQGRRSGMEDAHVIITDLFGNSVDDEKEAAEAADDNENVVHGDDEADDDDDDDNEKDNNVDDDEAADVSKNNDDNDDIIGTADDDDNEIDGDVGDVDETKATTTVTNDQCSGKTQQINKLLPKHSLFGIFDGHAGIFAARFASQHLTRILLQQDGLQNYKDNLIQMTEPEAKATAEQKQEDVKTRSKQITQNKKLLKEALEDTFVEVDRQLLRAILDLKDDLERQELDMEDDKKARQIHRRIEKIKEAGTTALVVLVTPYFLVCANAGDCRALVIPELKQSGSILKPCKYIALSEDHRPNRDIEQKRIHDAGGFVFGSRLEDDLAVSRGFGDYRFKEEDITLHGHSEHDKSRTPKHQKVSPMPEIKFYNIGSGAAKKKTKDKYVLLACDGIFECMDNEKVVRVLHQSLHIHDHDLELACCELLDKSLRKGSKDNMTAVLVELKK